MQIKDLTLTNFRNHKKESYNFESDVNVLYGNNGAGKTNILEAIHLLSTTKSFRAKYDRDLINYNAQATIVNAKIKNNGDIDDLVLQIAATPRSENTSSKKVKYNNLAKSLNNFSGYFYSVLFSPEDIENITGSPGQRRKYIDSILVQTSNNYKKALSTYTKAVRQRNKLLEIINETGQSHDQLPFWNNKILESGEIIQKNREELFLFINHFLDQHKNTVSDNNNAISLEYNKNAVNTKRLLDYKDKEIAAKNTLIGPHRDDFTVLQNEKNIAQFGSRGEQRTAIFTVKLAEIDYIKSKSGHMPVLLLDDIFSELDVSHREQVLDLIKDSQTIITTAEELDFLDLSEINLIKL